MLFPIEKQVSFELWFWLNAALRRRYRTSEMNNCSLHEKITRRTTVHLVRQQWWMREKLAIIVISWSYSSHNFFPGLIIVYNNHFVGDGTCCFVCIFHINFLLTTSSLSILLVVVVWWCGLVVPVVVVVSVVVVVVVVSVVVVVVFVVVVAVLLSSL